tara:strand:- start:54 stop:527 length:474 start_codon:yes stop_codon:yes gene_type:complete
VSIDIKKLSLGKRKTYRKQSKFLRCYSETRSKSVSALYAGISLSSVSNWIRDNYLEFEERYEEADLAFCEGLEQLALERVRLQDAKSNPVLLIALLNANLPTKYKQSSVPVDETAKGILSELRKIAKETPVVESKKVEEKSAIDQVNDILSKKGGMA